MSGLMKWLKDALGKQTPGHVERTQGESPAWDPTLSSGQERIRVVKHDEYRVEMDLASQILGISIPPQLSFDETEEVEAFLAPTLGASLEAEMPGAATDRNAARIQAEPCRKSFLI